MTMTIGTIMAVEMRMSREFRRATVVAGAVAFSLALAGCSTLEGLNPFGAEKYETKLLPEEPADQIYDQGLARLAKGDSEGAAKKFGDLDKQ